MRVDAGVVVTAAVCQDVLGTEGAGLPDRRRDAPSTASWGTVGPGSDGHVRGTAMMQRRERGVFRVAGRAGAAAMAAAAGMGARTGRRGRPGGSPGVEAPTSGSPLGDGAKRDDIIEGIRS